MFPSAHTHQTCGCSRPQLPASSGAEPSLPALKLGGKRTSKPSDTDLSLLDLKSLLRLHRRKVSSPAKGTWEPLWAPRRPKSELRAASGEGPRRTTRGLGFSSGVWVPEAQADGPLGPPRHVGRIAWWEEITFLKPLSTGAGSSSKAFRLWRRGGPAGHWGS